MSRRGNHEGSIRRRNDGRWEGRVRLGSVRKSVYGATRTEVAEKLAQLVNSYTLGIANPSSQTVQKYLQSWLERHERFGGTTGEGLRSSSKRTYYSLLRNHVFPAIGSLQLRHLGPAHLNLVYDQMYRANLAPASIALLHRVLHAAFEAACIEGILAFNPSDRLAETPRIPKREPVILTAEQVKRLLDAAESTPIYRALVVGVNTGLRRGEVLGLYWSDVDWQTGILRIERQLRTNNQVGPLKTANSKRIVPLSPELLAFLKRGRIQSEAVWLDGFLCGENGEPLTHNAFTYWWSKVTRLANLPSSVTFRALRRTYGTRLAEAGVPLRVIADILGHDPRTCLTFYQRSTEAMYDQVRKILSQLS